MLRVLVCSLSAWSSPSALPPSPSPAPSAAPPPLHSHSPWTPGAWSPATFPHFGPIHSVKRPTKARRVPWRPELPSGLHSGREPAFHQRGRDFTPFISYFPQPKIGSKLLRGGGGRGGREKASPRPTLASSDHPGHGGWASPWGLVGAGPRLVARASSGPELAWKRGQGQGTGPSQSPSPRLGIGMDGGGGPHLGAALGPHCLQPGGLATCGLWLLLLCGGHGQGPSGLGARPLFLHPLSP